jgi:hypothetical protein
MGDQASFSSQDLSAVPCARDAESESTVRVRGLALLSKIRGVSGHEGSVKGWLEAH